MAESLNSMKRPYFGFIRRNMVFSLKMYLFWLFFSKFSSFWAVSKKKTASFSTIFQKTGIGWAQRNQFRLFQQHIKGDLSVLNFSKTDKIICFRFKIELSCKFRKTAQFMAKSVLFSLRWSLFQKCYFRASQNDPKLKLARENLRQHMLPTMKFDQHVVKFIQNLDFWSGWIWRFQGAFLTLKKTVETCFTVDLPLKTLILT